MGDTSTVDSAAFGIAALDRDGRLVRRGASPHRTSNGCRIERVHAMVPPILPAFRTGSSGRNGGVLSSGALV